MTVLASFVTSENFRNVLYIIAFGLFIYGLSGLTGPKTAVRGPVSPAIPMTNSENATM